MRQVSVALGVGRGLNYDERLELHEAIKPISDAIHQTALDVQGSFSTGATVPVELRIETCREILRLAHDGPFFSDSALEDATPKLLPFQAVREQQRLTMEHQRLPLQAALKPLQEQQQLPCNLDGYPDPLDGYDLTGYGWWNELGGEG